MALFRNKFRIESSRLPGWDYSNPGYYFITVCTKNRVHLFGEIQSVPIGPVETGLRPVSTYVKSSKGNKALYYPMVLNEFGEIVLRCWNDLPNYYPNTALDEFVIMPNHIHGIIHIIERGKNNLSDIVRSLKSFFARRIDEQFRSENASRTVPTVWQGRFYDHIIRDQKELYNFRNYIQTNPIGWETDDLMHIM